MRLKSRFVFLFIFMAVISFLVVPHAESQSIRAKITVISIPGFTLDQLKSADLPHFHDLLKAGYVGAMNLRAAQKDVVWNSYATLGAGRRVSTPGEDSFYEVGEKIRDHKAQSLLKERLGMDVNTGAFYPLQIPFEEKNRIGDTPLGESMLGERLRRANLHTAVWGNADSGEKLVRFAPFLTMDMHGVTRDAFIGEGVSVKEAGWPYGIRTNYATIYAQWAGNSADLRVIELGDLYRLGEEAGMMTSERVGIQTELALEEIDRFLGRVINRLLPEDTLMVISPYVPNTTTRSNDLAPVILFKGDKAAAEEGLLYSPTTRRVGIVANVDLAPTILRAFGIEIPRSMDGLPMEPRDGSREVLWKTLEEIKTVYHMRPLVIYTYAIYQVAILIVALSLLLHKRKRRTMMLQVGLLVSLITPVFFLLLAGVPGISVGVYSLLLIILVPGAAYLLYRLPTVPLFWGLGLLGFLPILVDGMTGGALIRQSFLGYDPIIGARYYGIGNEYMGVVLGSAILMVAAGLEWIRGAKRWLKWGTALFFIFLVLYFEAPFWGTNAGGAAAASVGFAVAYARFFHSQLGKRFWFAFFGIGLAGAGLLFVMNVLAPVESPSHIGRAFEHLVTGDFAEIASITRRKLATNIRLIRASLWGKVFFISLIAMAVLIVQPLRGIRWLGTHYPYLFQGFIAILVAALSALAFNDSGIVSAATAIVYVVIPLLIIVCRDWRTENHQSQNSSSDS